MPGPPSAFTSDRSGATEQGGRSGSCDRRRFLQAAGVAAAALLLPQEQSLADDGALKIGVLGPFTGPSSSTGQAIRQGVVMALEDAMAEAEVPLVIGGQRRNVELVWVNSESDPDRAVAAILDAITQQGVSLMIGGWHSDVALAVMDAEVPFQILHFGHLGEARAIAERINRAPGKYQGWFKGWPSPEKLAALYGEPLNHFRAQGWWRPLNNKAAVMVEDTEYGRNWGSALLSSLQQAGFDADDYDLSALDQDDFSALLESYRQRQVSLVAMTTTATLAAVNFVKQFRQQGLRALLLGHGLRWHADWHALTGDSSDFIITMDSAMPIALWQRWWMRRYSARFKQPPSIAAAGLHYDYARMLFGVLNTAARLDIETLVKTVHQTSYRGIWNRYRFAARPMPETVSANEIMTGHFMEGFFMPMAQLIDGQEKIIWPAKYADQRFRPPPWV